MTARGVFERVGQLVFSEQRCKGKFNCTTGVLQALANPSAGEWSQFLFDTIQDCKDPGDDVNKAATKMWQQLSDQTHGQAWSGIEVEVPGPLDEVGRCSIAKICVKMGLAHTQSPPPFDLGPEFGEHRLDRVDIAVQPTTSCSLNESTCRQSCNILKHKFQSSDYKAQSGRRKTISHSTNSSKQQLHIVQAFRDPPREEPKPWFEVILCTRVDL